MRYVAVPVEITGSAGCYCSQLLCKCEYPDPPMMGFGSTRDEAFADLLAKLGYKEGIAVNNDMMAMFARCVDEYDVNKVMAELKDFFEGKDDGGDREAE